MMKKLFIASFVVVIVVIANAIQTDFVQKSDKQQIGETNAGVNISSDTTSGKKEDEKEGKTTPTLAPTIEPTNTPVPTVSKEKSNISIEEFIYPNSTASAESASGMTLKSSDSPDAITDWYKEKINSHGMNVTSFVVTKTNGNILNKLAGASAGEKINVTISKDNGDTKTTIELTND